jgi:hypothetical protein
MQLGEGVLQSLSLHAKHHANTLGHEKTHHVEEERAEASSAKGSQLLNLKEERKTLLYQHVV